MQTILKPFGSSALVSLLLILPIMVMEVVNRRNLNEDFPVMLFFVLWQQLLNGPNPEQLHVFGGRVPSQFIALVLFSLPVAADLSECCGLEAACLHILSI